MNNKHFFEKTPPIKLFFLAAIPGGVSMLASSLYGILDGVFIGRFLGEVAFAALNLAFPFVVINFSLADLIGVGSSVPISIHLGKKENDEANNTFSCACIMIILTGIMMGVLLFGLSPILIELMGASGELKDFAIDYIRVYALFSPITTIVFAMDNYLRICGKLKTSMSLNILMSILSAVLEFLFLAVLDFRIWGAALATCLGMLTCVLIALYPFIKAELALRFVKPRFSRKLIKEIIVGGSPNFLSNIAGRITEIFMNVVLLGFGGAAAVSVYGVLMYTGETIQSFLYGVCDSLQPAVGYNLGAGLKKRVIAIEKCCYSASAIIALSSATLIYFFPDIIINLFVNGASKEFMNIAISAMKIFSLSFLFRWFTFATQSFMTAIHKPIYASIISLSIALILPLILLVVLWSLGLNGIWINFPLTYLIASVIGIIVLLHFKTEWKSL